MTDDDNAVLLMLCY